MFWRNPTNRRITFTWVALAIALPVAGCVRQEVRPAPTAATTSIASASPSPTPSPPAAFSTEQAMVHIRELAVGIGPRPAGSAGEAKAVEYLESTLRDLGYETSLMQFERYDGGVSSNVIARFKGVDYANGYVIVGGHYDTVLNAPGANDNASGVGVVMALAQAFGGRNLPVEFVGFGAEEYPPSRAEHHAGSRAYAAGLVDPTVVRAMVSVDMVGAGPSVLIVKTRAHADLLQKEIDGIAHSRGVAHEMRIEGDFSDHVEFAKRKIPAAWLWSGSHPTLHRPSDKIEVVQPGSVERAGVLLFEWLRRRFP